MYSRSNPFPEKSFPLSSHDVTSPYLLLFKGSGVSDALPPLYPPLPAARDNGPWRHFLHGKGGLNSWKLCTRENLRELLLTSTSLERSSLTSWLLLFHFSP